MKKNVTLKIGASALALVVGASGVWADYTTFPAGTANYSTNDNAADGEGIENVVKVTGSFNGTFTTDHAFANVDVAAPSYDLRVAKSAVVKTSVSNFAATTDKANAGDKITYTYTVTNNSNVTLDGVYLVDKHISVADNAGNTEQTINVNECALPTGSTAELLDDPAAYDIVNNLAPNATFTCTYTYTVTQGDVDLLQATTPTSP